MRIPDWETKWSEFCEGQAEAFTALSKLQKIGVSCSFKINGKTFIYALLEEQRKQLLDEKLSTVDTDSDSDI